MDYKAIREVLHEHFKGLLERKKQRFATHGPLSELDAQALKQSHSFAVEALKTNDHTIYGTDAQLTGLINAYALPIKRGTHDYDNLRSEMLKGFRDYCTAVIEQNEKLDSYEFTENKQASLPVVKKFKERKLADCIEDYCEEKVRLKQWRPISEKEFRGQFALLLSYLSQDVSLHLSADVANDVKNMLLRLPKNRTAGSKAKLSISELLKLENQKTMHPRTLNKYIITFSTFYNWAVKKKRTDENNFQALIDNVDNIEFDREEFTLEQSKEIIAAAMKRKIAHHKWGVLIAFYTGARANEIAQLEVSDIIQEDDIWCFRISNLGENQSVKTNSSKRTIPIHPKLIDLGFMDLVNKAGQGRIFHKLSLRNGKYHRAITVWFNETLLPNLGIKKPNLVFHSIRHTVAGQLRNKMVQPALIMDIIGHRWR